MEFFFVVTAAVVLASLLVILLDSIERLFANRKLLREGNSRFLDLDTRYLKEAAYHAGLRKFFFPALAALATGVILAFVSGRVPNLFASTGVRAGVISEAVVIVAIILGGLFLVCALFVGYMRSPRVLDTIASSPLLLASAASEMVAREAGEAELGELRRSVNRWPSRLPRYAAGGRSNTPLLELERCLAETSADELRPVENPFRRRNRRLWRVLVQAFPLRWGLPMGLAVLFPILLVVLAIFLIWDPLLAGELLLGGLLAWILLAIVPVSIALFDAATRLPAAKLSYSHGLAEIAFAEQLVLELERKREADRVNAAGMSGAASPGLIRKAWRRIW